ncbi:MAG: TonB-dependent receptor, partial [Gemmatimonadetes bacterium]|nr:TonB-dependent receptor [Gemmatimonadota bacterium]
MPQASHVLSLALIVGALQALSSPLVAQSISSGTITGTVRSPDGRAVPQAVVTLTPLGTGSSQETTTTASGSFTLTLVQPGSYEIRVEALGYRPLIARVLTIRGGEERNVNLTLNPAPPPVTTIDTVALSGGSSTRFRAGGVQLGGSEIASLPYRFEDLASIAALSTAFDASLGSQGLPGDMSLVIADGVPFYRAPHPTARAEYLPDALFPRSALASVTAFHNAPDAEWAGSAGGYLALATRSSTGSAIELDGAYSGGPTWSSSELDFGTPSLLSFQGGARGTVLLTPGVSQVVLSGEALQQQTPLGPRVSEALAADLVGLDPELLTSLTEPAVETYTRYSALARLDVQRSRTSRVFLRGVGSFSRRDFNGAGPVSLARSAAPAEESIEFSAAGGIISESSPNVTMELRGGFSGSYRDFGAAVSDLPPAYLTALGVPLGNLPSAAAESSRTDFVVIPVLRYTPGTATLKFGATIRASSHTMAHSRAGLGDFLYSDAAALLAGAGFGQATSAPKASFGTQEYGVFAQYESALAPGLRLSFGGRYDYERFSGDDVALNTGWLTASGLRNDDFPDSFHQFGARGSLTWDPSASGGTRIFLTASMHEGDVDTRALYQLFADDTDATSTRFAGTGIDWPMGGIPPLAAAALPTLTLFGPDTRAPRSTNMSAALTQRMGDGLSVYVRASVRRTDFLMRRRNLNLPIVAQGADPNGRRILGTLRQDGSLITTTTDDARRFAGFGEGVAGLDQKVHGARGAHGPELVDQALQVEPRQELHDVVEERIRFPDVFEMDQVRMTRGALLMGPDAVHFDRRQLRLGDHFERIEYAGQPLLRQPDVTERAAPDQFDRLILGNRWRVGVRALALGRHSRVGCPFTLLVAGSAGLRLVAAERPVDRLHDSPDIDRIGVEKTALGSQSIVVQKSLHQDSQLRVGAASRRQIRALLGPRKL